MRGGEKTTMTSRVAPALAAAVLSAVSIAPADAQDWPTRPVRIVIGFAAGNSTDQLGRVIAQELSADFGQKFYIENRPGNSGSIAADMVAHAAPDGYTLLIGGSGPLITAPAINPNIGYHPLKDFTHIAMIGGDSFVLVANPALGVKNLGDLVKLARTRKDNPITCSSAGPGSLGQLLLERFKREAGIDILHVPAPNSGVIDVLGNYISMTITVSLTTGAQIKAGKVIPLGVTSAQRNPAFPNISTFAEQGYPKVHGDTWFWLAGPSNMPPNIVDNLNREVRKILEKPEVRSYFQRRALLSTDLDVTGVGKFVAGEVAYWSALAKSVGMTIQ